MSDADVQPIDGSPVPDLLRHLLARAERGEFKTIAVAIALTDGGGETAFVIEPGRGDRDALKLSVHRLLFRLQLHLDQHDLETVPNSPVRGR